MLPFYTRCRDTASCETCVLKIPLGHPVIAEGSYLLVEWYCEDQQCDCRRVLLRVCRGGPDFNPNNDLVTINFGWETPEFYLRWSHGDPTDAGDREAAAMMAGASLEFLVRIPEAAGEALYDIVVKQALTDPIYVERLKQHYKTFRASAKPKKRAR
jgi:hypothetical protein